MKLLLNVKLNYSFPGGVLGGLIIKTMLVMALGIFAAIAWTTVDPNELVKVFQPFIIVGLALFVLLVGENLRFWLLPAAAMFFDVLIWGGYSYYLAGNGWSYLQLKTVFVALATLFYPCHWLIVLCIYLALPPKWHSSIFKTGKPFERRE